MDDYQLGVNDSLRVITESIGRMISSPGVYVQFSGSSSAMNPLKEALADVLNKFHDKQIKSFEGLSNKTSEEQANAFKEFGKTIEGISDKKDKAAKANAGSLTEMSRRALTEMKNGNKSQMSFSQKFLGYSARAVEIGADLYNVSKQIASKISSLVATNVDFASELRSSGVLLKEGFDEGFIKYANMAGKDREELIELARENSRLAASADAQGLNGVELLSKESRKLIGTMGLSGKEINASIKAYNDSLLTAGNQAQLAQTDHEENLIRSTKALKMFAFATGQSYENIVKEQREREKSWQMQKLATDSRTRDQFKMLRNLGMSDDQIEAIMLGKANKASVMAQLDSDSAALFSALQSSYRNTKGDSAAFAESLTKISNSSYANNLRNKQANINPEDYAYIQGEAMSNALDPASQYGKLLSQTLKQGTEKALEDKDAQALNSVQNAYAEVKAIQNTIADSMVPSLETTAKYAPKVADTLKSINGMLQRNPWMAKSIGAVGLIGSFGKIFADSILPYLVFSKLGGFKMFGKMGKGILKAFKGGSKFLSKALGSTIKSSIKSGAKAGAKVASKAAAKAATKAVAKTGAKAATKAATKAVTKAGAKAAAKAGAKAAGKGLGKSILKKIPGISLIAGLGFAAGRLMDGDFLGAAGELASGAAGTIPGLGTAASVGIDAALAARDIKNAMDENAPANAQETSEYNNSNNVNNPDGEGEEQMCSPNNTVCVNGMSNVESLLESINDNTKALINELRNSGFQVGTNLAD